MRANRPGRVGASKVLPRWPGVWGALLASAALWGCAAGPRQTAPPEPPPVLAVTAPEAPSMVTPDSGAAPAPQAPASRTRSAATGEQALARGLKAYQAAQYAQAESLLRQALKAGLPAPADAAQAHKHLAFIYCTSRREAQCAAAFKAARAADARFALSKAEAGHPMWSQVYRRALGLN